MSSVEGSTAAVQLSTFELRWQAAFGPRGSDQVADFELSGGVVGNVHRIASKECVSLLEDDVSAGESEEVRILKLGTSPKFLGLEKAGENFFVRPCYEPLYREVAAKWKARGENRVLVYGNAGTGKSWFQVYALRRLLKGYGQEHPYLFVIRQIEELLHLIDLSNGEVRILRVDPKHHMTFCLDHFDPSRVLYFFEPLSNRSIPPLAVSLSSLTTLSPFEERIHEYKKNRCTVLYFPGWSLEHLLVAASADPSIRLGVEEVTKRFVRLGGIIRHVFASSTEVFEEEQKARILSANIDILQAITTGIDSDPEARGDNVSGYLLCYCNVDNRFTKADLDFTSDYVRCGVRERMKDYSIRERINVVVDHLNGDKSDRGGLHLQETVSFLLSQGSSVAWQFKRVPDGATIRDGPWSTLSFQKRDLVKSYTISEQLGAPGKVLVSTNPNFPLADIVFSNPNPATMIQVFQVTWAESHPFTVRALYTLRENHLKIQDTVRIQVFLVAPGKEDSYTARSKQSFLKGSVDKDLQYTEHKTINSVRLQQMWENTDICVLQPASTWIDTLRKYRGQA